MKIELKKLDTVNLNIAHIEEPKICLKLKSLTRSADVKPDHDSKSLKLLTNSTDLKSFSLKSLNNCVDQDAKSCPLSESEIKRHFYKPVKNLIKNNGYSDDGTALAGVDGLWVILKIIKSMMGQSSQNLIDILEENIEKQEEEQIKYLKRMVKKPRIETYYDSSDEEEINQELKKIKDKPEIEEEDEYIEECDGYDDCERYKENLSGGDFDFDE